MWFLMAAARFFRFFTLINITCLALISWLGAHGLAHRLLPHETLPLHAPRDHRMVAHLSAGISHWPSADLASRVSFSSMFFRSHLIPQANNGMISAKIHIFLTWLSVHPSNSQLLHPRRKQAWCWMQGDLFRRRRSNASSTTSTRHSRLVSAPEMDFLDDTDANGIDEWGVNGDLFDSRGDSEEDEIITQVRSQQRIEISCF